MLVEGEARILLAKRTGQDSNVLGLPGTTTNLRDQKVHTKWCILVFQETLQLGNLLPQHIWRVADASNDAETASVSDCSCEFWTCGYVHAGKHDRVVDFEEVGDRCSELLWEECQSSSCGGERGWGGHQRLDLRGDAMLSEWYSTDGRMYFVIGSGDQDMLGEEERRERDDEAVDNALSNVK